MFSADEKAEAGGGRERACCHRLSRRSPRL